MSLLKRIFGRQAKETPTALLALDRQAIEPLYSPALHLRAARGASSSKIGGRPLVDASFRWPEYSGEPLSFVAQLDLAGASDLLDPWLLPSTGLLLFFYHSEQATWGFDPKDRGSWRVIFVDRDPEQCAEQAPPALPRTPTEYIERTVEPHAIRTLPDWQDSRIEQLGLNDGQADAYIDECSSAYQGQPAHQLFGYASPQQGNDMNLECQLVSNGLYCGDSTGYRDPRAEELSDGASDWLLLLQVDSDDGAEMMWGDLGMLYFWIQADDLRSRNFANAWMILQCG